MTNVGMLDCQRPEHYRRVEIKVRVSVDEFVGESFGSRLRLPPDAPVGAGGSLCGGRLCLHPAHWIQATSPSWTIQENQTSPLFSHQPPRNHTCKGGNILCSRQMLTFSLPFTKLLSRLTRHWTSPLCLVLTAKVSRCLFRVGFQSLIYAWDDNAMKLQEREESITNGIHAKQALLFPLSEPPRLSADTLTSAERRLRAHTVCHNSFSSITAGPAGLSPLYFQLGRLTPLNSESGEAFGKIYKMTFRIKNLPPCLSPSLPLCGSIIQGFTVWKKVSVFCKSRNWILFIRNGSANHKSKVVLRE